MSCGKLVKASLLHKSTFNNNMKCWVFKFHNCLTKMQFHFIFFILPYCISTLDILTVNFMWEYSFKKVCFETQLQIQWLLNMDIFYSVRWSIGMADLAGCHRAVRGLQKHPCVYSAFVTYRLIDCFTSVLPIALNRSFFFSLSLCVLAPRPLPSPFTNTLCLCVYFCLS